MILDVIIGLLSVIFAGSITLTWVTFICFLLVRQATRVVKTEADRWYLFVLYLAPGILGTFLVAVYSTWAINFIIHYTFWSLSWKM